jgi:hypothetical protein
MTRAKLTKDLLALCGSVTAKRPRTVIDHIMKYGHITTEELKEKYGYNHPPRAARDVRELGIPLETFRVTASDGRKIAAYRFGAASRARGDSLRGRDALPKALKKQLIERYGSRCAIYLEDYPEGELQIDHRIPFEVVGDVKGAKRDPADFMLLCGSANRAKSWSCEHCVNWRTVRKPTICRNCYWAYPEEYDHVAMRDVRRLDIAWSGPEIEDYTRLQKESARLQKTMPVFVKDVLKKLLEPQ